MVKIDVFIPKGELFDQTVLGRRQNLSLDKNDRRAKALTDAGLPQLEEVSCQWGQE